jgi:MFS family permease
MPMGRSATLSPSVPRALAGIFSATLIAFLAVGGVVTILPRYVVEERGGGDVEVGIVVGAFAVAALLARPFAGRLADARGRRPVVLAGTVLMVLGGLWYAVPAGIAGLVVARVLLGLGEGMLFTAGATWAVDAAPEDRRGQVIGLYGLAIWGGLSIGPPVGEGLLALGGYPAVWAFSVLAPVAGLAIALALREPARAPEARTPQPAGGAYRAALGPGVALALANVGYATLAGFVVLHLQERGDGRGAAVFTAFAIAVVASRLLLGSLPDRVGARRSAIAAALAEAAGLAVVAAAHDAIAAAAGAALMGIGFSTLYPALALLVVDRVPPSRRGTALGGFTAFFDLGVGIGAPLAGAVAAGAGYPAAFAVAALCAAAAAAAPLLGRRTRHANVRSAVADPG